MTSTPTPAEAMVRIRMAMQQSNLAEARAIAEQARTAYPGDAALADAAGDLALKSGDAHAAAVHFAAACALAPALLDYAIGPLGMDMPISDFPDVAIAAVKRKRALTG